METPHPDDSLEFLKVRLSLRYATAQDAMHLLMAPQLREQMAELIATPEFDFLLAEVSGRVVGSVGIRWAESSRDDVRQALEPFGPSANMAFLEVAEDMRQRGVGARLSRAVLSQAAQRGVTCIYLTIALDNSVARSLYEGLALCLSMPQIIPQRLSTPKQENPSKIPCDRITG